MDMGMTLGCLRIAYECQRHPYAYFFEQLAFCGNLRLFIPFAAAAR